jgi:hypothetical protein
VAGNWGEGGSMTFATILCCSGSQMKRIARGWSTRQHANEEGNRSILWHTRSVNVKNERAEAGKSYGGRQTKKRIWV